MSLSDTIDVHCHIFNAADLPIHQFVRRVFLVDHPVVGVAADPLIAFVSLIMDGLAPSAQNELVALSKIQAGASPDLYIQTADQKRQIVQSALERLVRPNATVALARGGIDFDIPIVDRQKFVDQLRARVKLRAAPELAFGLDDLLGDLGNLAGELLVGGEELLQFVPWALTFTNYRFEILRQLAELSPESESEIALYVPALVDFNNWLKGPDDPPSEVTSIADQAAVMAEVSAMPGRWYAMHGYVAFDPWRQAMLPTRDILDETIRTAIIEQGFLGVKVYPPMGFRAIGNGDPDLKESDFPEALSTDLKAVIAASGRTCGQLLDDALIVLYDWCAENDVPIMAHCGCSNYAREDFAERASPIYWKRVLDSKPAYRTLRLNLGHIGGLTQFAEDKPGSEWLKTALQLVENYPNVYADLAYDSMVLMRDSTDVDDENKVARYLKLHPPGPNWVNKIMYGSDWIMLGLEPDNDKYYAAIKACFRGILNDSDDLLARFMKRNAARFLGLTLNGAKSLARQRLDAFYAKRGLSTGILDRLGSN